MAAAPRNTPRKKLPGSRIAALAVLLLITAALVAYLLFAPSRKKAQPERRPASPPVMRVMSASRTLPPETPAPRTPHKEQTGPPPVQQPVQPDRSVRSGDGSARLAIIIDDMGSSMAEARKLAAIGVPLTFAIIPGLAHDTSVAAYAANGGIETMIHIPMQSRGWPEQRLEANGLLLTMGDDELKERVTGFMERFPGAVGANNHMGSAFTVQEDKMKVVLMTLKTRDLYFIDSMTAPGSTGVAVARSLGIKSARRTVFLDNEQERSYIAGQISQAVRLARKSGSAIAICHPHPATLSTLAAVLPSLASQGVQLVPASRLVN